MEGFNYSNEQLSIIQEMQNAGVYTTAIPDYVSVQDVKEMCRYALLGQEYESALKHYDVVRNSITAYLGSLYVGVEPDDEELLAIMETIPEEGLVAESKIDALKQKAAYKYLYNVDADNVPNNLLYCIWSSFNRDIDTTKNMGKEEAQFWWEMIPSSDYVNAGSTCNDIIAYISNGKDK